MFLKFIMILFAWGIILCVGGCADESPSAPKNGSISTTALPIASPSQLAGEAIPIRYDVEQFILSSYPTTGQRGAAFQFASVVQEALSVDPSNSSAVRDVSDRMTKAINCLSFHFSGIEGKLPAAVANEIEKLSVDTRARKKQYRAFAKALDGTAGTLPSSNTCDERFFVDK